MAYRAALIGCGNIGSGPAHVGSNSEIISHAAAYTQNNDTILTAVCDANPESAKKTSVRWNVPNFYTDIGELLKKESPDFVSVCTPNQTHHEVLLLALQTPSVRAIWAEKPLTLNSEQAEQIVRLAKQQKVAILVNYTRRYSPAHQRLRDQIQLGALGKIQSVQGYYTKGILHNGTHWLDLARWLVDDISNLQGFQIRNEFPPDAQVDVRIQFQNGTVGYLQALDASAFSLFEMDILGTKGRVKLLDSGHRIEYFEVRPSPHYLGYQTLLPTHVIDGEMDVPLHNALADLISCVKTQRQPACSGDDGIVAIHLAERCLKSAQGAINQLTLSHTATF